MTRFTTLLVLLALAAGVLRVAGARPASPAAAPLPAELSGLALLRTAGEPGSLSLLELASGTLRHQLPDGVLSPDGETLWSVEARGTHTRLLRWNVRRGELEGSRTVAGQWTFPKIAPGQPGGLSPLGRWLAVEAQEEDASRFLVLRATLEEEPVTVSLPPGYHFDALRDDGSALYLEEYPDRSDRSRYQVRWYNLRRGLLEEQVIVDKRNSRATIMSGTRQLSVPTLDGSWLFSLYQGEQAPFLHALNMREPIALCIALPGAGAQGEGGGWSMALDGSGRTLFVANGAAGLLYTIDTAQQTLRGTHQLDRLPDPAAGGIVAALQPGVQAAIEPGGGQLAVTDDLLFLLQGGALRQLDPVTLAPTAAPPLPLALASIGRTADGRYLVATARDEATLHLLDAASGQPRGALALAGGRATLLRLLP